MANASKKMGDTGFLIAKWKAVREVLEKGGDKK